MFRFHNHLLPDVFSHFFTPVSSVHNYNTRLASKSSYVIPKSRTNYGKFSIGFEGAKVWNSIDESLKTTSFRVFKKNMMLNIVNGPVWIQCFLQTTTQYYANVCSGCLPTYFPSYHELLLH
jgi:hypothetical protein